jgi:hypothetical protein
LRQSGDELSRKFLYGIEEAKPQAFLADMDQKIIDQRFVIRFERSDKYLAPENDVSLPLRRIRANAGCQFKSPRWHELYLPNDQ